MESTFKKFGCYMEQKNGIVRGGRCEPKDVFVKNEIYLFSIVIEII